MNKLWNLLKTILTSDIFLPVLLVVIYLIFLVIVKGVMPTQEELIHDFAKFYLKYGLEIIFTSAFLESLILVNLFVPGQLAVALGVIFARANHTSLLPIIAVAAMGAVCGYMIDFLLGYFGFADMLERLGYGRFLEEAHKKVKKYGGKTLALGFIHPNVASFLSLAVGTSKLRFSTFTLIAIPATFFWVSLWALLIYLLGDIFLMILTRYSFLLILLSLGGFLIIRLTSRKKA
jgi:membrane protein DedA with SNARE-associated domain